MKSPKNRFSIAPSANIQRSSFNRDSTLKTTFDAGPLFPIFVDEALPGDTFKLRSSFFARMETPLFPIMDNAYLETFFFEVPVRQVYENWEKLNGEQDNPEDSTDYLVPTMTSPGGGYSTHSLEDYFGLPIDIAGVEHSALYHRAYAHIWNTWFRDQNLQDRIVFSKGDGPDNPGDIVLMNRGKRHDYFTSCLPWPQKSDSGAVDLPLGTDAPIKTNAGAGGGVTILDQVGTESNLDSSGSSLLLGGPNSTGGAMYADLTEATAATINQLRQSIEVQRLFETDARGGTRYIEQVYNHFKVRSPDLRLQRPGYMGGGRSQLNITPVAQTTPDPAGGGGNEEVQGSLAAFGTISAAGHGFTKSFTEHTIIIGLANVRADLTYQNTLDKMWSRQTRFDHFWPELATIGEQAVLRKEIWPDGTAADEEVFGYQERFAEMRYKNSKITGLFRSQAALSLDAWHLSQDFGTAPVLGDQFITEKPPFDRVIAVPDQPHFIMDCFHKLQCARPMPLYGIPGLDKL